jgi:cytochrome c
MRSTTTSGLLRLLAGFTLTLAALTSPGCSGASQKARPAPEPPPDGERRERLRAALRAELGQRYDQPIPPPAPEAVERGTRIYDMLCESCHGRTGRGNGRSARLLAIEPPDLTDPAQAGFFSDSAKLQIIADGLPGTPMIGWKSMLSEQERLDVLQFMRSLSAAHHGRSEVGS